MRKLLHRLFRRHDWIMLEKREEWVCLIPYPYDYEVDGE